MTLAVTKSGMDAASLAAVHAVSGTRFLTDQFIALVETDAVTSRIPTLNDLHNSLQAAAAQVCGIGIERAPAVAWDRSEVTLGSYVVLAYTYAGDPQVLRITEWKKEGLSRALKEAVPLP